MSKIKIDDKTHECRIFTKRREIIVDCKPEIKIKLTYPFMCEVLDCLLLQQEKLEELKNAQNN